MARNALLHAAVKAKKDKFYTQLGDIQNELRHYKSHFEGKTVLCNCDDPFESQFFQYFALKFVDLKLKKLIATSYASSPIAGKQFSYRKEKDGQTSFLFGEEVAKVVTDITTYDPNKHAYKAVVTAVRDATGNGGVAMVDVAELFKMGENTLTELAGDGDFRSPECLALLDEADIVVTNPPFSLFREYVTTLMEHDKKFIIIGNQNAITYKEIFPLLKENKIWLGYGFPGNVGFFESPYEDVAAAAEHKEGMIRISGVMWFTNLDIKKRHAILDLEKEYSPELYPKFDNYDVINVDKTLQIPCNYRGAMGVPITFMDKYNPDQFELLEGSNRYGVLDYWGKNEIIREAHSHGNNINGKAKYFRIHIRYTPQWIANHPYEFGEV